ncbi:AAA family ATPase [Thermaerobacter sp. FW80]|uniref:AAA family ATPase n=1 Tax=Thermaerobacter sp. FW80 TaxID=2546351 RepID=UPI001074A2CD|nr:AAA family ATPase [Thermaerobacter sp. FW80]QBS37114.1 AAA family ATPase [Thermaerobacter sp. FW80]
MNVNLDGLAALVQGNGARVVERRPAVKRLADVAPEEVKWLWYPYVPLGKLTILEGDPGVGKTWLALRLAAAVSRGEPLPGLDGVPREWREPANVLYLTAEDGLGDTLRPRLDAAGADPARVFALTGWRGTDEKGREHGGTVTLQDLDVIEAALAAHRPALVVVDPIQAYVGAGVDIHRANEVRAVLSGMSALAERYGCAVVLIRHLAKSTTDRAIYRGLGSIDFAAAVRSMLVVAQDPNDEEGRRRIVAHSKASLTEKGPSLAFSIRDGAFFWEGVSDVDAEALLAPRVESDGEPKLPRAIEWLLEVLAEGPVPSREIEKRAEVEIGASKRTLWRAARQVGVRTRKVGRTWVWELLERHGTDTGPTVPNNSLAQLAHFEETRATQGFSSTVKSRTVCKSGLGHATVAAGETSFCAALCRCRSSM